MVVGIQAEGTLTAAVGTQAEDTPPQGTLAAVVGTQAERTLVEVVGTRVSVVCTQAEVLRTLAEDTRTPAVKANTLVVVCTLAEVGNTQAAQVGIPVGGIVAAVVGIEGWELSIEAEWEDIQAAVLEQGIETPE